MSKKPSQEEIDAEQAERREYVKNIGIEYRYGCYEVGHICFCRRVKQVQTYCRKWKHLFFRKSEPIRANCWRNTWKHSSWTRKARLLSTRRIARSASGLAAATNSPCTFWLGKVKKTRPHPFLTNLGFFFRNRTESEGDGGTAENRVRREHRTGMQVELMMTPINLDFLPAIFQILIASPLERGERPASWLAESRTVHEKVSDKNDILIKGYHICSNNRTPQIPEFPIIQLRSSQKVFYSAL